MHLLKCRTRRHILPICCAGAALAAVWLAAPGPAFAQSAGLGQSRNGGISGSSPQRMGSSSGTGLSSQGSGLGGSGGMAGGGSGGIGLHGLGGSSTAGSGGAGGTAASHAGSSISGAPGGTGSSLPGSRHTKPKLALKPASDAMADSSATHSQYDYNYGAEDIGRDSSTIYKSRAEVAPTNDYKFGATDPR
jgi:hypothetical protein